MTLKRRQLNYCWFISNFRKVSERHFFFSCNFIRFGSLPDKVRINDSTFLMKTVKIDEHNALSCNTQPIVKFA